MASKNCPHCSKQVPVACKKCVCGHVFFTSRRNAGSVSRDTTVASTATEIGGGEDQDNQPTRRSGRVTRERPNFYDALEYENQTRRQKQLLRKQSKTRTEEPEDAADGGSGEGGSGGSIQESTIVRDGPVPSTSRGIVAPPPAKKRRGRPPGITGRKTTHGYKIHNNNVTPRVVNKCWWDDITTFCLGRSRKVCCLECNRETIGGVIVSRMTVEERQRYVDDNDE